jgi:hypothetical protein
MYYKKCRVHLALERVGRSSVPILKIHFGTTAARVQLQEPSCNYDNEWFRRSSLMKDAAKIVLAYEKAKHITDDQHVSKKVRWRKTKR